MPSAQPVARDDAGPSTPAVSVLMPVYNTARYLPAAIDSILSQSFSDFELLVVDDGSTDDSPAIARDYAQRDRRVRPIRRPHQGIPTVNDGLAQCRAPLIARADSDDVNHPRRLELQVTFLREHPQCVAVGTWLIRTDPDLSPAGQQTPPTTHAAIDAALLRGDGSAIVQGTTLFRAEALRRVGGWRTDFDWVEDLDLYLRLAEVGELANLSQFLYQYCRHLMSVCWQRYEKMVPQVERVVRAAWQRRGLPGGPDVAHIRRRLGKPASAAHMYRSWACHALQQGRTMRARRHAIAALVREPLRIRSWRVLYWALAA